jgi:hypothetical protein
MLRLLRVSCFPPDERNPLAKEPAQRAPCYMAASLNAQPRATGDAYGQTSRGADALDASGRGRAVTVCRPHRAPAANPLAQQPLGRLRLPRSCVGIACGAAGSG